MFGTGIIGYIPGGVRNQGMECIRRYPVHERHAKEFHTTYPYCNVKRMAVNEQQDLAPTRRRKGAAELQEILDRPAIDRMARA